MKVRVVILSRMLGDVIIKKVPFEQRSEEVREQAMWLYEGRLLQDEEQNSHTVRQENAWHLGETIRWPSCLACVNRRAIRERSESYRAQDYVGHVYQFS